MGDQAVDNDMSQVNSDRYSIHSAPVQGSSYQGLDNIQTNWIRRRAHTQWNHEKVTVHNIADSLKSVENESSHQHTVESSSYVENVRPTSLKRRKKSKKGGSSDLNRVDLVQDQKYSDGE